MEIFKIILFLTLGHQTSAMIGYDCGSKILNMTTISLLDIDECDIETDRVDTALIDVFLLQLNEYEHVNVIQCKVEINRVINYCGMHSHISIVQNAYMEYVHTVTREACQAAHDHGTFRIGNTIIDGLLPNSTTLQSIALAGSVTSGGACSGTQYSDPYGTWDSVVVMGTV